MTPLAVGAQCEGYGGIYLALQRLLPVQHAWYAEFDPGDGKTPPLPIDRQPAAQLLAHHFPGVPNHGDITTFNWRDAAPIDVFTSGFPCQGFSVAGRRNGSTDRRHLWPTGVLPAITALRPALVILENVPGLLTIENGQVFGRILADLTEVGYSTSWVTAGGCHVGSCHHRHRVFIAAVLQTVRPPDNALFGIPLAAGGKWPPAGHVQNHLVWETAAPRCQGRPLLPTPTARDAGRGVGWGEQSGRPLSEVVTHYPTWKGSRFEDAVNVWAGIFGRSAPPHQASEVSRVGRPQPSAEFPEWMMGLPSGFITDHLGREDSLRLVGNGVLWQSAVYALPLLPTFQAFAGALT